MSSVNRVFLIGRLGGDVETRQVSNGSTVANFSLATTDVWYDDNKQKKERTEWHSIVVWNKQAENCAKYLSKGSMVCIEGKIQTETYEKDGVKRYTTKIMATSVTFLSSKSEAPAAQSQPANNQSFADIPF